MQTPKFLLLLVLILAWCQCQAISRCSLDEHSFFNCDELKVEHTHLNVTVDFAQQALVGHVDLYFSLVNPAATKITLDSRHLQINSVYWLDPVSHQTQQQLAFQLVTPEAEVPTVFGKALQITPATLPLPTSFAVRIFYVATNQSESIQFLQPAQTAGKKYPYLFTQNEAIHARSMLPCADSPAAKSTYSATIAVQQPLVAAMSAKRVESRTVGGLNVYEFEQNIAVVCILHTINFLAVLFDCLVRWCIGKCTNWSPLSLVVRKGNAFSWCL